MTIMSRQARLERMDRICQRFEEQYPEYRVRVGRDESSLLWRLRFERENSETIVVTVSEELIADNRNDVYRVVEDEFLDQRQRGLCTYCGNHEDGRCLLRNRTVRPGSRSCSSWSVERTAPRERALQLSPGAQIMDVNGTRIGYVRSINIENNMQPVYTMGDPRPRTFTSGGPITITLELVADSINLERTMAAEWDTMRNRTLAEEYLNRPLPVDPSLFVERAREQIEASQQQRVSSVSDAVDDAGQIEIKTFQPESFSIADFFNEPGTV